MNALATLLELAAEALEIADDHGLPDVQVNPPLEWGIEARNEDAEDGWVSTMALAKRLREAAAQVRADCGAKVPRGG